MAETEEKKKLKTVYEFDLDSVDHHFTKVVQLAENEPLGPNQTMIKPEDNNLFWNGNGWTDQLVTVYEFDAENNNVFTKITRIPQGAVLASNQTFAKPEDGLYEPITFNGAVWIGTSKEEWEKAHPAPKVKPNTSQVAQANTLKDIAQLKVDHSGQQSLNAQLMKDNAELKVNNETQSKLNADLLKQLANLKVQVAALAKPAEDK